MKMNDKLSPTPSEIEALRKGDGTYELADLIRGIHSEIQHAAKIERQKHPDQPDEFIVGDFDTPVSLRSGVVQILDFIMRLWIESLPVQTGSLSNRPNLPESLFGNTTTLRSDLALARLGYSAGIRKPLNPDTSTIVASDGTSPDEENDGSNLARAGAKLALDAARNHLARADIPSGLLLPLKQLSFALRDLDNGKVHPLLMPAESNKRPPYTYEHMELRVLAAAIMDLFMQGKEFSREEAAIKVSKKLVKLGVEFQGSHPDTPPFRIISGWRDKFKAGSSDDIFVLQYEWYCNAYNEPGVSPNTIADKLLKTLGDTRNVKA